MLKSTAGATRQGVYADHFDVGAHAPITFDGVPLNLAEDPVTGVKGYITYINHHGGINGRKARSRPVDDLVTSPITFEGSPNRMIGAKKFVLLEGKSNLKYRQVTEITPGLVDQF